MASRPRCLIVTRNFPPLTGGMERLNQQVSIALQQEFDIVLCGPRGCAEYVKNVPCIEFSATPAWRYVIESLLGTLKMAIKFKPDIIYAGSGVAAHAAVFVSFFTRAPVVTYLHGLDIIAPDRLYQTFFLPAIRRSDAVIVNSKNTAALALRAGVPAGRINIIHPGVALPDISKRLARRIAARAAYALGDRPLLLAAGRLTPRKGLVEFIEKCLPGIVSIYPEACLAIVGEAPVGALGKQSRNIQAEIRDATTKLGLEQNVVLLGKLGDEELSSIYFAADLFVFPVLDLPGDVEGFGMVAIEAAAHGLPTVGFSVGGIPDAVAEGISGHLAAAGNYEQLTQIVVEHLSKLTTLQPDICRRHAEPFTWSQFSQKIRNLLLTQVRR